MAKYLCNVSMGHNTRSYCKTHRAPAPVSSSCIRREHRSEGEIRGRDPLEKSGHHAKKISAFPTKVLIFRKDIFCRRFVRILAPIRRSGQKKEKPFRDQPGMEVSKIIYLQWPAA